MGNLSHYNGSNNIGSHQNGLNSSASPGDTPDHAAADGYASEDFVQGSASSCRERKKGWRFLSFLFLFDLLCNCMRGLVTLYD